MIPPKTDPRWKTIVAGNINTEFSALPTKMMMMRIRLLAHDRTPQKIEEAIDIAHDFFSQNASVVKPDIDLLFGNEKGPNKK